MTTFIDQVLAAWAELAVGERWAEIEDVETIHPVPVCERPGVAIQRDRRYRLTYYCVYVVVNGKKTKKYFPLTDAGLEDARAYRHQLKPQEATQ